MNFASAVDRPVPFYDSRGIVLYNASFEDVLPHLPNNAVSSLITDPPYATTNLKWDKEIDWCFFWSQASRICQPKSPMVLFSSGKFVNRLINTNPKFYRYELIWEKNLAVGHLDANRRPLRSHETILVFSQIFKGSTYNPQLVVGKRHSIGTGKAPAHYGTSSSQRIKRSTNLYHPKSVLRFNNTRSGRSLHPTQKPLDLMKWLVLTYSDRGDTILEPFAGSGSTLAAAAYHGRKAIAIEQNQEYCDVIAERLEKRNLI